jgi:Fe-S cluster assembly ATPase SufC
MREEWKRTMLEIKNLQVTVGDRQILNGLDLSISLEGSVG